MASRVGICCQNSLLIGYLTVTAKQVHEILLEMSVLAKRLTPVPSMRDKGANLWTPVNVHSRASYSSRFRKSCQPLTSFSAQVSFVFSSQCQRMSLAPNNLYLSVVYFVLCPRSFWWAWWPAGVHSEACSRHRLRDCTVFFNWKKVRSEVE